MEVRITAGDSKKTRIYIIIKLSIRNITFSLLVLIKNNVKQFLFKIL